MLPVTTQTYFSGPREVERHLVECTKQCTRSELPFFQLFQCSWLAKLLLITFSGKHVLFQSNNETIFCVVWWWVPMVWSSTSEFVWVCACVTQKSVYLTQKTELVGVMRRVGLAWESCNAYRMYMGQIWSLLYLRHTDSMPWKMEMSEQKYV